MEALETYASALIVLSVALLLVAAGVGKKQLVWKRAKPRLATTTGAITPFGPTGRLVVRRSLVFTRCSCAPHASKRRAAAATCRTFVTSWRRSRMRPRATR